MAFRMAHGTLVGTGAAINVGLGFTPNVVIIINETDPGLAFYTSDMADAEALKLTDAQALTFPTSNGISAYSGSEASASVGFTLGADSDLNGSSDVIHYVAFGND